MVAIWNSLAGVPVTTFKFKTAKAGATKIWESAHPRRARQSRKRPQPRTRPKPRRPLRKRKVLAREGSKTAQVVALLQRKNGATLAEIMDKMGWQNHTVGGFMAGAMKKAGYAVESFKSDKGERTYRINE